LTGGGEPACRFLATFFSKEMYVQGEVDTIVKHVIDDVSNHDDVMRQVW